MDTLIGQTIDDYEIIERIGHGGMSEVFRAIRIHDSSYVALKLLHSFHAKDPNFLNRFEREARAMASLNHPNIVRVYDFNTTGDTPYIAMQYVPGGTLKDKFKALLREGKLLPFDETMRIIIEIADALAFAHQNGLIHRDIKPANILFDETGRAILTDFGIVKTLNGVTQHTATGAMIGTPAYMSPEQGLGRPGDARSDVYALGTLFFQMITGRLPFDADKPLAVVLKHINDPIPLPSSINPDIPDVVEAIVLKALAKSPFDRFQTAENMAEAIRSSVRASNSEWSQEIPVELLDGPIEVPAPNIDVYPLDEDEQLEYFETTPEEIEAELEAVERTMVDSRAAIDKVGDDSVNVPQAALPLPLPTEGSEQAAEEAARERAFGPLLLWFVPLIALLGLVVVLATTFDTSRIRQYIGLEGITALASGTRLPTLTPQNVTDLQITVVVASNTPLPAAIITPTNTVPPTATPTVAPTSTDVPTAVPVATELPPTVTPIPEPTTPIVQAIPPEDCVYGVELISAFTYNLATNAAPISTRFPMNWIVRNSGSCDLPDGLSLVYQSGETFGQDAAVQLSEGLAVGAQTTLTTRLTSPGSAGRYDSRWQLVNANNEAIGAEIPFLILVYELQATNTPVPTLVVPGAEVSAESTQPPSATSTIAPTATTIRVTATPAPTETPEPTVPPTPTESPIDFSTAVQQCEYEGSDWRCLIEILPEGSEGNLYTIQVFDADAATEYTSVESQIHLIAAPRCSAWTFNINVLDESSGASVTKTVTFDPNEEQIAQFFGGQCTDG